MRLTTGQLAPQFVHNDLYDVTLDSRSLRGKKILLSFYRYASCPFCNLRFHALTQKQSQWQARGLETVAIFQSPKDSILEYAGSEPSVIRILPDPERTLYQRYGVEGSWAGFVKGALQLGTFAQALKSGHLPGKVEGEMNMIPADFVIDEQGTIRLAYYGKDISDHVAIEDIERLL
ncbi:redoxin domain-containing protein [Agitococcus lubricus]|uniref:Peroxiredoxin n=1 Tax=Agitococcus lubricus TaxID=1077255 RepID=A0A2T5IZX1_9GAMM|nr:redoxin domain-containing protein [Agitococcus lubricus]PTQ89608.1 peroxiredoxin [Agitococcus lubricus]